MNVSTRHMARIGLVMLREGEWTGGERSVTRPQYLPLVQGLVDAKCR